MKSRSKPSIEGQSRYLLTGSIIAILIAFTPYLFYIYEIFPSGAVWENSFFSYESKYYENVLTAAWTYLSKIVPLFLLLIWFLTCKHWWYHVILVPMIMYAYQLISAIYEDAYLNVIDLDNGDLIFMAPFFIIVLSVVYLIRIKIFDRVYGIDLSEIERENLNPFSPLSDKDYDEIESFRKEEVELNGVEEDYYVKL